MEGQVLMNYGRGNKLKGRSDVNKTEGDAKFWFFRKEAQFVYSEVC